MAITETTPGAPMPDDHGAMGAPSPATVARGYEEDVYDSRTVLSVPILVILFFVLAFGTVTILFGFIAYPKGSAGAHPEAAERNKRPLNERLMDNDRGLGSAKTGDGQPRLEPLRLRSGPARAITRPELPAGNSPEIHPEDIRPSKERFPAMYGEGGSGVGIGQVMGLDQAALKSLFPVQKGATTLPASEHVPTLANAGRGASESKVILPPLPKGAEPKANGPKKEGNQPEKKDQKQPEKNTPAPAPPPGPKGGKQ
jgi:hypothetical protein